MPDSNDLTFVVGQLKGSVDAVAAQMAQHMSDSKDAQDRIHKEIAAHAARAEKNFEVLHERIDRVASKQDEVVRHQDQFRVDVEIIKGATAKKAEAEKTLRDVIKWALGVVATIGGIFIAWFAFFRDMGNS